MVVAQEHDRVETVTGVVKDYPQTPLNSLVDTLQMALLEAGFSFEAEVLRVSFDVHVGGEDAKE